MWSFKSKSMSSTNWAIIYLDILFWNNLFIRIKNPWTAIWCVLDKNSHINKIYIFFIWKFRGNKTFSCCSFFRHIKIFSRHFYGKNKSFIEGCVANLHPKMVLYLHIGLSVDLCLPQILFSFYYSLSCHAFAHWMFQVHFLF